MKKNLRIVSAAAAALLAVAPVAAGVVPAASVNTVQAASVNTVQAADQANQPVSTNVAASTSTTDLVSSAKAAAETYFNAHQPANNGMKVNGASIDGSKVTVKAGNISYAAGTPQVNSVNGTVKTANVDVALIGKVTVTAEVASSVTEEEAKNAEFNLGPSWGNHAYSTASNLKFEGLKDHKATYTLELPKITVNFGTVTTPAAKPADTAKPEIDAGSSSIFDADANTNVNISAVAKDGNIPLAINGNITATLPNDSTVYTALLHGDNNTKIYEVVGKNNVQVMKPVSATELRSNKLYYAHFNHVTMSLGNKYSGKSVTFTLPNGSSFAENVAGAKYSNYYKLFDGTKVARTITVTADANGVADLGTVVSRFYAYNAKNMQEVHFYDKATGNVVTNGTVNLHAVNGKTTIQAIYNAMVQKYVASQLVKATHSTNKIDTLAPQNDLRDQLKKQNITVDPNGYFTAPASLTLNMNAKSKINGAEATLPVTVNYDNVTPAASQETTKTITIMHISTVYDKNGVATHEPALRAYDTYQVVSEPVTLKKVDGKDAGKFYKLAGKDQYIKVGNVDGTKRTLRKNAVIYKSTGKPYMKSKKHRRIVKAGSEHTTYGKSFMIAGHQMYRVGRNQYIKKANF